MKTALLSIKNWCRFVLEALALPFKPRPSKKNCRFATKCGNTPTEAYAHNPMKTAVLISGHMRTFARCLPNQRWMVYRHLPDPHFFVSAVDDEQADSAELLRDHYKHVYIERVKQPDIPEPDHKYAAHAPYAISVPVQAVLRQLWHLNRVHEFFRTVARPDDFTTFVRCRPDLHFHRFLTHKVTYTRYLPMPGKEMRLELTESNQYDPWYVVTPWWGRFGGCNDRFAIMGRGAALQYFSTYNIIEYLINTGCPLHPESLLKASIESHPMISFSDNLLAEFSTIRMNGECRPPEISAGDIAELHSRL